MSFLRDVFTEYQLRRKMVAATSLRAPLRTEIMPITVTTASKRFAVPELWKGSLVRIQADGGNVYVQVSTAADATCDIAARAVETGTPIALTPPASGNGCYKIVADQFLDVPFPADALSFALIGSAACCARAHLSET
jgi:hypothetical protein